MVDFADELSVAGRTAYCVQHIQAPVEAERLAERAAEVFGHEPLFISEIGPVIGVHTGPGLLGIGGIAPAMLARS
jgi:fatty acid-binding protein DegV